MSETTQGVIHWTWAMLQMFKRSHKVALDGNREQFVFEGREFMTAYAKYLIEYLETAL